MNYSLIIPADCRDEVAAKSALAARIVEGQEAAAHLREALKDDNEKKKNMSESLKRKREVDADEYVAKLEASVANVKTYKSNYPTNAKTFITPSSEVWCCHINQTTLRCKQRSSKSVPGISSPVDLDPPIYLEFCQNHFHSMKDVDHAERQLDHLFHIFSLVEELRAVPTPPAQAFVPVVRALQDLPPRNLPNDGVVGRVFAETGNLPPMSPTAIALAELDAMIIS